MQAQRQPIVEIDLLDKAVSQPLGKEHPVARYLAVKTPCKRGCKMKPFPSLEFEYDRHTELLIFFAKDNSFSGVAQALFDRMRHQSRIVDVPLGPWCIQGGEIGLIKGSVRSDAYIQVGIGEKRPAEGDQIGNPAF